MLLLWLKAFHVVALVTWFAGLFYLPRLFVYHADARDAVGVERFKVMERRLFALMTIGACATLAFGSRPYWMAEKNSRSCNSMPFIETSTFETSIWLFLPSNRSS